VRPLLGLLLLPVGLALALTPAGCSPPEKGTFERKAGTRASANSFRIAGVTTVFEKRCGSLDCHGNSGRNLRLYSARGLRLPNDAGIIPGQGDTTLEESTANYQSILTLEPEETNAVLEGGDPHTLLMLKKPLELEKHKGGRAINKGDDAERCIVSWFEEDLIKPIDKEACSRAAIFPKE
jgi:hypothetical protein